MDTQRSDDAQPVDEELTSPQAPRRTARSVRAPEVSARFRAAVQSSGIAQREIGRAIGMDESKLSKSISGQRRFQSDELFDFATVTGVTVSWLLTGTDSDDQLTAAPALSALPARNPGAPRERERSRRRIVEEAWDLFSQHGYERVRMADIAKAAEVSAPALHYHFTGKWEIFAEAMRYSVKLAYDRQLSELGEIDDPAARLRALVQMQLPEQPVPRREWSIWVQMWAAAATDETARAEHENSYSRWERTVRDQIRDCIDAGLCRPVVLDEAVLQLTGLIDGLGIRVLSGLLTPQRMRATVLSWIDGQLLLSPNSPDTPDTTNTMNTPDPSERTAS
jgi:AcrR family transcriptional regulator